MSGLFKKKNSDTVTIEVPNRLMLKFVESVESAGKINHTAIDDYNDAMRVVDLYHDARTLVEKWKEQR